MTALPAAAKVHQPELELVDRARAYFDARRSPATRRAYARDWTAFAEWCRRRRLEALPASPVTVVLYASELAERLRPSSIDRHLAAVAAAHVDAGHEPPTRHRAVREALRGIRRVHGGAEVGKAAVVTRDVRRMVDELPDSLIGWRDRALLLLGFAGAMRRSELVALDVDDVHQVEEGLVVTIRRSKTDQEGAGRAVGIPYGSQLPTCPVRALRAWLEASGITEGALFRPISRHGRMATQRLSGAAVALVVKRAVERIGLDPADYAGHSLRAGLVTAATEAGVVETAIMAQTRQRSLATMQRYVRHGSLWKVNAAARVGL